MRRALAALGLLGALALAGCGGSPGAVQTVDAQQFITVSAAAGATTIDVRTPQEFAQEHVANAVNIDVESPSFDTAIAALDHDGTYAVYCHSGRRSAMATDAMAAAGFTHVVNLDGGLADLAAAGAPLESSVTAP